MSRYFIEVAYKGTGFSGFQVQKNANSVQAEVEKALSVFYRKSFELTGSSRTDTGVHALQNFFHFDSDTDVAKDVYNLNSILPANIVIKRIFPVKDGAHCRFDAVSREYRYYIFSQKNPFLQDRAYYYPYPLNMQLLQSAAAIVLQQQDFASFSKRNTQVKSFQCNVFESEWMQQKECMVYRIRANRFLRGMVKGLVGTMLLVGREKISIDQFCDVFGSGDCKSVDFSVSASGLFLCNVDFDNIQFDKE
jgi:tRNA pseudouridine38-40 synthase